MKKEPKEYECDSCFERYSDEEATDEGFICPKCAGRLEKLKPSEDEEK